MGSPFRPVTSETETNAIDAVAYDVLRERLAGVVRRICPPWLARQSDDLIQVALLRLVDVVEKSEQERTFNSSYLYKVAYSALIDEIRRLRARREVAIEHDDGQPMAIEAPIVDPERHTAGRQLGKEIADCLRQVIKPRRRAVTLHLLGHTAAEAATLLARDLKQARNLTYRGLADLRACLTKKGIAA